ncbi:MAG: hypothetical protein K2N71_03225, partial [Oscillospiraceae bacterium]|nr:hypothetical protein [Oscillospiraceae bacterium]
MDNTKMDILGWTAKIVSENSRLKLFAELEYFIIEAIEQNMITIYEAFQLMEICDRITTEKYKYIAGTLDSVQSLNMALMAKLFNENA